MHFALLGLQPLKHLVGHELDVRSKFVSELSTKLEIAEEEGEDNQLESTGCGS